MQLKPFAKHEDEMKKRAANEVQPITIPFQSPDHLVYSNGVTDKCYFLRSKQTGEIYAYNQHMAESGNVHYLPHYDLALLKRPEFAGEVAVWRAQNRLPQGFDAVEVKADITDVVAKQVKAKVAPKAEANFKFE